MEPKLEQQEQDELLFSFLNTDCVDSSHNMAWSNMDFTDPPSPPYSTSSNDSVAHLGSPPAEYDPSTAIDMLTPDSLWQFMSPIVSDDGTAIMNGTFQPLIFPAPAPIELESPHSSPPTSDSEQNKRKRGRKAKTSTSPPLPNTQLKPLLPSTHRRPSEIAVRANIAPSPNPPASASHVVQVKAEPVDPMSTLPQSLATPQPPQPHVTPQQAAMAKRQERLIKNRAAALLSRKRKREHLNSLEEENAIIKQENDQLKEQVAKLTSELQMVKSENEELKAATNNSVSKTSSKNSKTTGMVFMIMLFSFALFSLPNGSVNRLTVGGSSKRPLIGPSGLLYIEPSQQHKLLDGGSLTSSAPASQSSELMVVESIKAHDLQTWIQESLRAESDQLVSEPATSTGLVQYQSGGPSYTFEAPSLYLYANQLSQVVRLGDEYKTNRANSISPRVSLLSPLQPSHEACEPQQYLQVDMQVIGSKVVGAQMVGLKDSVFVPVSLKDQLVTPPASSLSDYNFNNTDDSARKTKRRRNVRSTPKRNSKVVA